jgi:predicted RND superfamily exporter protein
LRVGIDPSMDPLVAADDPARIYYEQVRRRFGNDEAILVVLHSADAYAPDALERLRRLTGQLDELEAVVEVESLINTSLGSSAGAELHFEHLQAADLADPALAPRLRAAVQGNPLIRGQLVSADGRAAAIVVHPEVMSDREMLAQGLVDQVIAIADAHAGPATQVWVTGGPVIRAATSRAVMKQLRWVVPAIVILLTGLLALAFRSWRGVVLPLATIVLALGCTLATLSLLDRPLNLITSLVPPLLVTMGLAYCAHILSEFESLSRELPPQQRIALLLHEIAAPVVLTGLTTIAGLLALAIGALPATMEFAWLSALGVFYTVVLALTFVPACLRFAAPNARDRPMPGQRLFEVGSRRLGLFDMKYRRTILVVAGLVFVGAVASAMQIRIGDQFVGIFPEDARVRADYERVNRAMGGVSSLPIVIDAPMPGAFTDPVMLREVERLQAWLAQQPEVGSVTGLADHVKLLNANLARGGSAALEIPQSPELIKQLYFFGDGPQLQAVVDRKRASTLVSVRLNVDDTADISAFLDRLRPRLAAMGHGLKAQITGNAALLVQSVESATAGQIKSVGFALLLVYLCLSIQFTSFGIGLLASVPTALQTALYFGALGLSGVTLNATTSLVECLVLGLAVDDTIHYLARFNAAAKRSGSEKNAAVTALSGVLRPITLTKAILAAGFLMLATGDLANQVVFGWLAALTLFSAWLVDVFVTPAFMSRVRIVTLWDSLRLDLGRNVQATIPIFAGLSTRQARIFALLSKIEAVQKGTRVIRENDPGGDVFVVIDGELSVSIERDGQRTELRRLKRGDLVGEQGYFGQKRTADVDAVSRARLLRFDDADQEQICRRYPAIAARVFLNMNKIQAERRAEMQRQQNA